MRYATQFFVHDSSPYCRQEFYKELLTDEYRKNRFFELGKREGMSEYKINRCLHDGQVPLSSAIWVLFCHRGLDKNTLSG